MPPTTGLTIVELAERVLVELGYPSLTPERVAAEAEMDPRTVRRAFPTHHALVVAAVTGSLTVPTDAGSRSPPEQAMALWRADVEHRVAQTIRSLLGLLAPGTAEPDTLHEVHRRLVVPTRLALDRVAGSLPPDERDRLCATTWAWAVTDLSPSLAMSDADTAMVLDFVRRPVDDLANG